MIEIGIPPLIVWVSCFAAFGVGYIVRWFLEENGIDIEEQIRKLFGR